MLLNVVIFGLSLTGCIKNINNDKVTVNFIVETISTKVEIVKGDKITLDLIPSDYKEMMVGLYYDNEFINEYNDNNIYSDIDIYIKIKEQLNTTMENIIIEKYISNYYKDEKNQDDIYIEYYFGKYKECYVVLIKDKMKGDTGSITTYIIEDIEFKYPYSNRQVLVYINDKFQTLQISFDNDHLTIKDLNDISKQLLEIYL